MQNVTEFSSPSAVSKPLSLWRNRQIISLILAVAVSFLGIGITSPLRTLYARTEGVSGGQIGIMSAAYLLSSFVFLLPFGWLSDKFSRMYTIVIALAAHGVITAVYIFAHTGEQFIALRFLEGITTAAVMPSAYAMLSQLTPRGRNGEAFGMMGAATTFGFLAGPPIGTLLASTVSYTAAYLISGFLFLPAVVLIWLSFRRYRPVVETPDDKSVVVPSTGEYPPVPTRLWTTPIMIGLLIKLALGFGPGIGITVWSIYCADIGFNLTQIGLTYTVYALPILFFSSLAGRLSDKYGKLLPMLVGSLGIALLWSSYGFLTSFVVFMVLGVFEGILDAVARSSNDGWLADNTPPANRGIAQSYFNGASQFGSLIAAIGAGFLYEINKGLPFIVMGIVEVLIIFSAAGLALYHRSQTRQPLVMALK